MRTKLKVLLAALVAGASILVPSTATGQELSTDALYVNWATWLPAYVTEFDPGSADDCVAGRDKCAIKTVKEMTRLVDELAGTCSHNAVFALAYTRISQGYAWIRGTDDGEYYSNTAGLNYIVEVFARTYLKWWNRWATDGPDADVPASWQTAFAAADGKTLTGSGDLIVGINAHINRDLAFVLAASGLVNTDGTSRKADYDKVNNLLYLLTKPLTKEEAQRFDPSMDNGELYSLGDPATFNLIASWRERAWRNAEDLLSARDTTQFEAVAQRIETDAAAEGGLLAASTAYLPPLTSTKERDAYCSQHYADAPPTAYPFSVD